MLSRKSLLCTRFSPSITRSEMLKNVLHCPSVLMGFGLRIVKTRELESRECYILLKDT